MARTRRLLSDTRLLIVEDEVLIAILVEDFAAELGCRMSLTAATAGQALLAIKTFVPQLALVECSLNQSGPEFVVADALDDAAIPFIFTSCHDVSVLPARHRRQNFLAKPFSVEALKSAILRIRADQPSQA
jgi:two-component SAPR family response regulator